MGIVLPHTQFGSVKMCYCFFLGVSEPDKQSLDLPLIRNVHMEALGTDSQCTL